MKYNLAFIFFFCILFSNYNYSNSSDNTDLSRQNQDSKNLFDQEKLDNFKADEVYNYSEEKNAVNWWTDFKEWLSAQLQKLFGDDYDPNSLWFKLLEILPYVVIAFAFVLLVWFLARSNPGSQVMRQHHKSKVILTEEEELLMKRDLERLAEEAISQKELRHAIRYFYLHCIKRLDMKRIIRYSNEKTNYEYVKEIEFDEISRTFRSLTLSYEQIWYGHMVFDEAYFNNFKQQYQSFHNLLDQKQYAQI